MAPKGFEESVTNGEHRSCDNQQIRKSDNSQVASHASNITLNNLFAQQFVDFNHFWLISN